MSAETSTPVRSYAIVSGSTRKVSQSSKVARYLVARLQASEPGAAVEHIDLSQVKLPEWNESFWDPTAAPDAAWSQVSASLARSQAIILVTPEWNGMVPPALMNVFLLAGRGELAHKPGMIVAVSASTGGAYSVAELRVSGQKNTQLTYTPDHIIVRDVRNVLNESEPQSDADTYLRGRIDYALRVLGVYSDAFARIRASGVLDPTSYPYGM